jgi:hypothetical protein
MSSAVSPRPGTPRLFRAEVLPVSSSRAMTGQNTEVARSVRKRAGFFPQLQNVANPNRIVLTATLLTRRRRSVQRSSTMVTRHLACILNSSSQQGDLVYMV